MGLTDFLLARTADEEAVAREAIKPENTHPWGDIRLPSVPPEGMADEIRGYLGGPLGEHCARWGPVRVLAWCAAMRAIVELHRGNHECSNEDDSCAWILNGDCDTNWHLAQMWIGHPDYDSAWNR